MSDEIYEVFDEIKKHHQERHNKRLAAADDFGWSKHADTHWYRMLVDDFGVSQKLHWWPSANKWLYKGQYYRGGLPKWLKEKIDADNLRLKK